MREVDSESVRERRVGSKPYGQTRSRPVCNLHLIYVQNCAWHAEKQGTLAEVVAKRFVQAAPGQKNSAWPTRSRNATSTAIRQCNNHAEDTGSLFFWQRRTDGDVEGLGAVGGCLVEITQSVSANG
jgi:hypothetical protein